MPCHYARTPEVAVQLMCPHHLPVSTMCEVVMPAWLGANLLTV